MFKFLKNLFTPKPRYLHLIDSSLSPSLAELVDTGYRYGVTEREEKPTSAYEYRELFLSDESAVEFLKDSPEVRNVAGVVLIDKNVDATDTLKGDRAVA